MGPELRGDFDWLAQQPGAKSCCLRDLLEPLNLASVQRGQFAASLPENEWREFVLSPWIEGAGEDIAWRRELWEWLGPRVRRETGAGQAAQVVARELHKWVSLQSKSHPQGIAASWLGGVGDGIYFAQMHVAALRSAGIPARFTKAGGCERRTESGWERVPDQVGN